MKQLRTTVGMVLIALLISPVIGQDGDKIGGLRFGFQSAGIFENNDMISGTEPLQTFYVGMFRDNKIIPILYFGSGLEYFQNGAKIKGGDDWKLHYISVPLNVKVKLGPVFALTGFAPSFKVSESAPAGFDKSHWFDAPFLLGAGVKIFFITVEARYHWGTIDVNDSYRNQYFQLGAGLSF